MTVYNLSDKDIVRIDGFLHIPQIRERANFLRRRLIFAEKYPGKYSEFISEIVDLAEQNGVMGYDFRPGECALCGSGKTTVEYKSGLRKGEINPNRTRYSRMLDLKHSFVRTKFYTPYGVCNYCREHGFNDELAKILSTLEFKFEWNNEITPCPYKKDKKSICFNCEKEMWESEMDRSPTMFGRGTYPSICPHCGAEALGLGSSHKSTDKWRIIEK